jgi:hypothetical protein
MTKRDQIEQFIGNLAEFLGVINQIKRGVIARLMHRTGHTTIHTISTWIQMLERYHLPSLQQPQCPQRVV